VQKAFSEEHKLGAPEELNMGVEQAQELSPEHVTGYTEGTRGAHVPCNRFI